MLIHSLEPRAGRNLLVAMGLVVALYAGYYAVRQDWNVAMAAGLAGGTLLGLGVWIALIDTHPARSLVLAALTAVNVGAIAGITELALNGIVWFAPLVFVNLLLGGVRMGALVTLAAVSVIVYQGGHYQSFELTLNIIGALALSLLMAATFGQGLTHRFRHLEDEALRDQLTGLWNRRALDRALDRGLSHSEGTHELSLVLFDLDHFKQLNDAHGHDAGDRVLKQFAGIASGNLRQTDHLYRYGGEEFAVLLQAPADAALAVAEKVRLAVAAERFFRGLPVTVSAGVAEARRGDRQRDLLRRADSALYAAKKNGRDRCELASGDAAIEEHVAAYSIGGER